MKLSWLAAKIKGRLIGEDGQISGFNSLKRAKPHELSFVIYPQDILAAKNTKAICILTTPDWAADYLLDFPCSVLLTENLPATLSLIKELNLAQKSKLKRSTLSSFIHATAEIGRAELGENCFIGAQAFLGDDVKLGSNCHIGAGAVIGDGVFMGSNVKVGSNSVIGKEAFAPYGLSTVSQLPSLGNVCIGDNVSIGALCTVDYGLVSDTLIGDGTMLDNMVHVGHDASLGKNVVIAAQSAVAGFVEIEDNVTLGGQVGVTPHAHLQEGCRISAKSLARGKVGAYEIWSGNPSMPHKVYLQSYAENLRRGRKSVRKTS